MINVFTHVKEITYIIINKLSTLCVSLLCWGTLGGLIPEDEDNTHAMYSYNDHAIGGGGGGGC